MRQTGKSRGAASALAAAVAVAVAVPTAGCNNSKIKGLKPVEGVVIYEGVPLAWASVSMNPVDATSGGKTATAVTDENGRFTARTLGQNGAFPGEYVVAVEKFIAGTDDAAVEEWEAKRADASFKEPRPEETTIEVVSAIPAEYSNSRESGLTASVPENGIENLELNLTK